MKEKIRVAVLMGGISPEYDVSLRSGETVLNNLNKDKYDVLPVSIGKDGEWEIPPKNLKIFADIAFIAMHGKYGEDGTVQDILDTVRMPYTGSAALPSALGMNKIFSQKLFNMHGLNTPEYMVVSKNEKVNPQDFEFPSPLVVKPAYEGSSIGVSIVRTSDELITALEKAFSFDREVIIQKYIPGQEITVSIIEDEDGNLFALTPLEIIPTSGQFFDYSSKYTPGGSEEILARIHNMKIDFAKEIAKKTHEIIGASGMSRTDMILSDDDRFYVLEINTIPGMTNESLLPKAAKLSGYEMHEVLDRIVHSALRRHNLL